MARSLVICVCSQCADKTWTDEEGEIQRGNRIPASTRSSHHQRDNTAAQHTVWLEQEHTRQGSEPPDDTEDNQLPPPNIGEGE